MFPRAARVATAFPEAIGSAALEEQSRGPRPDPDFLAVENIKAALEQFGSMILFPGHMACHTTDPGASGGILVRDRRSTWALTKNRRSQSREASRAAAAVRRACGSLAVELSGCLLTIFCACASPMRQAQQPAATSSLARGLRQRSSGDRNCACRSTHLFPGCPHRLPGSLHSD